MSLVIRGGRVIDPSQDVDGLFDLVIEEGLIKELLPPGKEGFDGMELLDATGKTVLPGFVDIHTHLRDPGHEYKEDIESGTRAAAAGGVTSVVCMANTDPVNDRASVTEDILKRAKDKGHVRVFPVGALTKGLKGVDLAEIGEMKQAGIVAVSDDGMPVASPEMMRRGLEYCLMLGLPVISHAEDPCLSKGGAMNEGFTSTLLGLKGIPNATEDIMVLRDIALAELTSARLHIAHVSTAGAVSAIREAKARGVKVTAEAAPHHFMLTEEAVEGYNTDAKMSPPLRSPEDVAAIKEGLRDGTIDAIATDHAPHSTIEKEVEFACAANGIIGLETLFPLTLKLVDEGLLTLNEAIIKLTVNPAGIVGIEGGTLKKGAPADIAIADMDEEYKIDKLKMKSKSRNTPFHGWKVKGRVHQTLVDGKTVYNLGVGNV